MGRNEANGKQVAVGCVTFILMAVVVGIVGEAKGINAFLGLLAIVILFLLGAILTGALKD